VFIHEKDDFSANLTNAANGEPNACQLDNADLDGALLQAEETSWWTKAQFILETIVGNAAPSGVGELLGAGEVAPPLMVTTIKLKMREEFLAQPYSAEAFAYWSESVAVLDGCASDPNYITKNYPPGSTFRSVIEALREKYGIVPKQPDWLNNFVPAHDTNEKTGPVDRVTAGQHLDYRIEFENEGEGIAYGVYFIDILDNDLDSSTLSIGPVYSTSDNLIIAPPGSYDPNTRSITWPVGEVGPKMGGYANISVDIRSDAPFDSEIINYGTVIFPSVPEITRTNGLVAVVGYNRPPAIMSIPNQTVNATESLEFTINATDPDRDSLTYQGALQNGASLPEGATIDSMNGIFRWTPTTMQTGTYLMEFTVADFRTESRLNVTIEVMGAQQNLPIVLPGSFGVPTDTNHDGKYDDVNGNGRADFADVVLYFNQMSWIAANEPLSAFDYNGNGRIDFADVVWLFNHL
jgi:uncharacterized repeat protein (TIGR01451 family)